MLSCREGIGSALCPASDQSHHHQRNLDGANSMTPKERTQLTASRIPRSSRPSTIWSTGSFRTTGECLTAELTATRTGLHIGLSLRKLTKPSTCRSMIALDSPRWSELRHAYGTAGDMPPMLRQLESFPPHKKYNDEPWWSSSGFVSLRLTLAHNARCPLTNSARQAGIGAVIKSSAKSSF